MSSVIMRRFEGFYIMPLHPQKGSRHFLAGNHQLPAGQTVLIEVVNAKLRI